MINLNKNNLKTKIISLITAIALWLYVIAVVDPEEKKVIENIPITITNMSEINKDGFVVYPKEDIKTDITLEGKLSEINKLSRNNIHIYGEILNPVEGQNIITLRTNISNRVSRDLKDTNFVVNLERKINKVVPIKIKVPDNMKSSIESMKKNIDDVIVSGPRTLVNTVNYVGNTLVFLNSPEKAGDVVKLSLIPYTKDGIPVENVKLSDGYVKINVRYTMEKTVPIKLYTNDIDLDLSDYTSQPDSVKILGDEDVLKEIDSISTKNITKKVLEGSQQPKIEINIPNKVRLKDNIKTIILTKK